MQNHGKKFVSLTALLLLLSASPFAVAEIYKYVDLEGRVHFSDEPLKGNLRLVKRFSLGGQEKSNKSSRIDLKSLEVNRQRFSPLIETIAQETLLRPELLHAVIRAESAYDPNAISRKGAVGLMQLMPATAKRYGVADRRDPHQNLRGGASYLKDLLVQFGFDLKLAIAAYNAGENAVIRSGYKIPNYRETQNYVAKVMRFYRQNQSEESSGNS